MEKYLGVKKIEARPMTKKEFHELKGWPVTNELELLQDGYLVVYPDGYKSWSPKAAFDEAYRKIDNMTFGLAIEALKKGHKVARKGWNGKGMWVSMTPGKTLDLAKDDIWTENIKSVAVANGGKVELQPYLTMKTANDTIQIGWLASQSDMLSEDWMIV